MRLHNLRKQVDELREQADIVSEPPEDYPYLPPRHQAYFWRSETHFLEHQKIDILSDFDRWSTYMKLYSAKNPAHPWHQRDRIPDCILEMINYENKSNTKTGSPTEAEKETADQDCMEKA